MEWRISLVQRTHYLEKIFRPLLPIRWRRRQPLLKQPPLPSVTKIIKGRTHLPITGRMVMVIAHFFEGACLQIREQAGQEFLPIWLRVKEKGSHLSEQSNIRESEADMPPIPRSLLTSPSEPTNTPTQEVIMPTPSGLSSLGLDISLIHQYITYPVGGRLTHFVSNWKKITQDPWILQTVQGLRLEFINPPPNLQIRQPVLEVDKAQALSREVEKLAQKEAICPVQVGDIGFMSPILVVLKSDRSWQPVINLKSLNQYVKAPHFKMESIKLVKGLIQEGDWLTKLDLKDAYLTLPVHQAHQKYLRFQWQDQQW